MKYSILIVTLVFTGIFAQAQSSDKAKALLDEVYTKVKSYDNIAVNFKFALHNSEADVDQEFLGPVMSLTLFAMQ